PVSQSGTAPLFTTTGTLSVGSGRTFMISGGTFNYNSGSIAGTGTLSLSGATGNFTGNFSSAVTGLALTNSTVNGPGVLTNAASLTISSSTINATLINQ